MTTIVKMNGKLPMTSRPEVFSLKRNVLKYDLQKLRQNKKCYETFVFIVNKLINCQISFATQNRIYAFWLECMIFPFIFNHGEKLSHLYGNGEFQRSKNMEFESEDVYFSVVILVVIEGKQIIM